MRPIHAPRSVAAALPASATFDWRDQVDGAVWARRGEVLAVPAPGNSPGNRWQPHPNHWKVAGRQQQLDWKQMETDNTDFVWEH